jgi:sugar phosphate isomerase/epimerase
MINNLKDALTLVETAGAKNGGLILDIAHVMGLGFSFDHISRIPLQHLICLELNDGTLPGSPNYDPSRVRRFCGEGEFDIKGFINCIHNMGYKGPWAVEVMSPELAVLPLKELSTRAFNSTIAEFNDLHTKL